MAIKQEHLITAELADWQTPVIDKDLTTSPGSPSNGDKYIIAGTGGDWSAGTINDIVWYINSEWFFITPTEGMQIYLEDENIYYFFNGSVWGTMSGGSGDMLKSTYDTGNNGIVDKAENVDDGVGNATTAAQVKANAIHTNGDGSDHSDVVRNSDNIMINAFKNAINGSLTIFNMIDGMVDEYEDESGIDTASSTNESYDSTDDFYKPTGGSIATPFAHLKCNDNAANTTVTDDGSGANSIVSSTNTSNLYDVSGRINSAFSFNGSDEYVNLDTLEQDIDTDVTGSFSFWMNPTSLASNSYILGFGDTDANNYFAIHVRSDGDLEIICNSNATNFWQFKTTTNPISTGSWFHIVLVQNGTAPVLYVNNSLMTLNFTSENDKTAWFADMETELDNGRLGCRNWNNNGNFTFYNGKVDDFRYYQNTTLSTDDISALYNSGSGTEDSQPALTTNNMTLISEAVIASSAPDNTRMVMLEEDVDSITLNTDLKAYASNDDGANWHQGTLSEEGDYDANTRILVADFDVSAQTDTDMVYKLETLNNKDLKIHGTALSWD